MLGLFCLHLNTIGRSGHVTSTIRRENFLGFKSLWLGFRIRAYSQGLVVRCLALGLSLQFTSCSGSQTVVRVPLVVGLCEGFQCGGRIGLLFLD